MSRFLLLILFSIIFSGCGSSKYDLSVDKKAEDKRLQKIELAKQQNQKELEEWN